MFRYTNQYLALREENRKRARWLRAYYKVLDNKRASIHEKQFARRQLQFMGECEAIPLASAITSVIKAYQAENPDVPAELIARAIEIAREGL